MRIFPWKMRSGGSGHIVNFTIKSWQHKSSLLKQTALWIIKWCLSEVFFGYVIKHFVNKRKKKFELLAVYIRRTATLLMSLTPLNRSLHICLFRFVDLYLWIFPVIYLKQHLSRGVQAGKRLCAVYLSQQHWHSPTPLLCSPFKETASWKAHLPWNLWDHFKFLSA